MNLGMLGITTYSIPCLLKPKIDVGQKTAAAGQFGQVFVRHRNIG
jgi:hypothetical protein